MKFSIYQISPLLMLLAASTALMILGTASPVFAEKNKTRVLLLGASVGQEWEVEGIPKRLGDSRFQFEAVQAWQFDKTAALEEALMRPKRKFKPTKTYLKGFFEPSPLPPDAIVIKECAAYFPGEMARYKSLIPKWVASIKASGKKPALATVVPVTSEHAIRKPGRIEAIREFNDWIKEYAAAEKLPLVDLEAALRKDAKGRFLKAEYTSGDGLHLNRKAYDVLDRLLLDASAEITGTEGR
ncbi:MAG: SGNH/GDSL hydrolase family protein [Deltaproteobacteria bacterium]|nr:SGNH/GDSL hydrolase family protein [Deltaproteobacteria bacterium]